MSLSDRASFGIAIPQIFVDESIDPAFIAKAVRQAEELGYASLWTQEQILGSANVLEPISLLNYAAGLTTRARLGVSVLVLPLRNPVQLAKSLTTLDQLSAGRLTVGLGIGGHSDAYPAFGVPSERRVYRFNESVRALKSLWGAEPVSAGALWPVSGVTQEPKSVQRPHPPIWLGGRHPDALRRAVRLADGWMGAGSSASASFRDQAAQIRAALAAAGRDPSTFTVAKRLYIAVDDDRARAERRLRRWFQAYYGSDQLANRVSVWGDEATCAAGIADVIDAGAQVILLNPVFDQIAQAERLARIVGL